MIVVKVPFYDDGRQASAGADSIVEELESVALNESGLTPRVFSGSVAAGDGGLAELESSICDAVKKQPFNDRLCLVGGDHSVTYAGFKAFAQKNPGAAFVVLSSYPGCAAGEDILEGSFMRRMLRDGLVAPERVIIFGVRRWDGEEKQFLETSKIKPVSMRQVEMNGLSDVMDGVTELMNSWQSIYLSIGLDVADPSCAPGVLDPDSGGLTARQLLYMIQRFRLMRNIKMLDLVCIDAEKDVNGMSAKLAAKVLSELS
jgi:agmatinase